MTEDLIRDVAATVLAIVCLINIYLANHFRNKSEAYRRELLECRELLGQHDRERLERRNISRAVRTRHLRDWLWNSTENKGSDNG